jgi:hypothetical protein
MSPADDDARPAKRQRFNNACDSKQIQSYQEVAYSTGIWSNSENIIEQGSGIELAECYATIISGGPGDDCEHGEIIEDEQDAPPLECCYGMVGIFVD